MKPLTKWRAEVGNSNVTYIYVTYRNKEYFLDPNSDSVELVNPDKSNNEAPIRWLYNGLE